MADFPRLAGRAAGRLVSALKRRTVEQVKATRSAFRAGLRGEPAPPKISRRMAQLYARLELEPGGGPDEVDRAFKRLVRRYHPDRFEQDPEKSRRATVLLQELNLARAELLELLREPGA